MISTTKRTRTLTPNNSHVLTGLDVLLRDGHPALSGARIGLITNHTAVTSDLAGIADARHHDERSQPVRRVAPEQGVRGAAQAGDHVEDEVGPVTGLPVVSLYGANRTPSAKQLDGLDAMIFDM